MKTVTVLGNIDNSHRLSAQVPPDISPGPITVLIVRQSEEDVEGDEWLAAVAKDWANELNDPREDIYTLNDGEPVA
jgi:hypothetical protein